MVFHYSLHLYRRKEPACKHVSIDLSGILWDVYGSSLKILRYVWIVAAHSHPTIAWHPET